MRIFLSALPLRRFVSFSVLTLGLVGLACSNDLRAESSAGPATTRVTFANSLAPLPNIAGTKAVTSSHIAASSVAALSAKQLAVSQEFHVAMAMRNFTEFQTRVSNGEYVPFDEMEAKYLPLPGDYAAVRAWLVGQGFTVTKDDERRLAIFLSGTPAQIQASFEVKMQGVTVDGTTYAAATTAPSLPAGIAGSVLGINDLQPYLQPHRHIRLPAAVGPTPEATTSSPFTVPQVLKAYDATNLSVGGTTLTGANQKIAIIIDAFPATSDLTGFWNANGISQSLSNIEEVNVPNGTIDATSGEETLDVEWSSSVAPGCKVRVYLSDTLSFTNINKALSQVATDVSGNSPAQPTIHEMSMSLGIAETSLGKGSSIFTSESQYFATIANGNAGGGVSVFVSAGDGGSVPSGTLSPEYESTDPNVTGVGGTSLTTSPTTGLRTSEVVWDDVTASQYAGFESPGATGGGTSIQFTRPAWQVGTGVISGSMRLAPDVASIGAESSPGYLYYGGATYVAGTSWSSPTWAGIAALINHGRSLNSPVRLPPGLLNPRLYPLVGTNNFFDVTSGNNTLGSSKAGSTNGVANYTAGTGYDECTGLGVPDVANLVKTLLGPTVTSFSPSNGVVGTSVAITGTNFYTSGTLPLAVTFNGTAASFTLNSATQITAVVPAGATAGPINVTSLGDTTVSSPNFGASPNLQVVQVSTPTAFNQGDNGDSFTVTASNAGIQASAGVVTVTVTTSSALTLVAASGTGWTCVVNGSTCVCTRSDALASGASYPATTVTVNVSPSSGSSVFFNSVVTNSCDSYTANSSIPVNAVADTPTRDWRYLYFGTTANTGNAADTANPAGDGIPNLLKYALGLDPTKPETNPETEDTSTGYLQLTVPKNPNATDITYSVQVTSDLTDPSSWTSTGTTVVQNITSLLQVRDNTPVSGAAKRFIRLQISR